MLYKETAPDRDLAKLVKCVWVLERDYAASFHKQEHLWAVPNVELIFTSGHPYYLKTRSGMRILPAQPSCASSPQQIKMGAVNELETYEKRIRELAPDVDIKSISLNCQGLVNDVVIVNRELVFRFPKAEHGFKHLKNEARILRFLKNHITLAIPSLLYESNDVLGYRMIPGEPLRRDVLIRLPENDQQAVADQLAQFLKELHGVPISELADFEMPIADALMKYERWAGVYQRIREKVFPLLMPHLREWVTELFESQLADRSNFEYELRMADTDIMPYHIMFDRQMRRINGVIDFGCAGLGDPAIDFGIIIYNFGESFLDRFYRVYPEAETYLKRARFYASAQEVRWLLTGIEKNDPWWFAVHVGSAKDMK